MCVGGCSAPYCATVKLFRPAVHVHTVLNRYKVQNLVQWMFGAWATPYINTSQTDAFRRVIHMSQLAQSGCLRAEAEHYRRGRDSPAATGGSLYWMLNDNWPAPSWTSLEYGGRQKLLHFEASRMFSPIAVSMRHHHTQFFSSLLYLASMMYHSGSL